VGDPAGAVTAFAEALDADPSSQPTRERLTHVLIELGDYESGFALANQLIEQLPNEPVGQVYAGRCLMKVGKRDQGFLMLERAQRKGARSTLLYDSMMEGLREQGDEAGATRLLESGIPSNVFLLADPYERKARSEFIEALPLARRIQYYAAAGRVEDAEEELDRMIAEQPSNPELLLLLADLQGQRGLFDEAAATLDRVEEMAPASAELKVRRGMIALQQGNIEAVGKAAAEAIALDPANVRAYWLRGIYLHGQKRVGEARDAYERALSLAPDDGRVMLSLAQLLVEINEFGPAIPLLEKLVERSPEHQDLLLTLRDAYAGNNQPAKAQEVAARYMTLRMGPAGVVDSHLPLDLDQSTSLQTRDELQSRRYQR
jgi:predicted Zn-dependent protease